MLEILSQPAAAAPASAAVPKRRLPPWLKRPMPQPDMLFTGNVIRDLRLETVCSERPRS
jgi:hypothetical protein